MPASSRPRPRRPLLARLGLVASALLALVALPLVALPLGAAAHAAEADVDAFRYSSWHVAVALDTRDDGRAVARIEERITAEFPETDQNRGIVRGIPDVYQGARTDPREVAVTDGSGAPVPFELDTVSSDSGDDFLAVLTGDDRFVHGSQEYVISYTLDDVVLARDDGAADEFYWDLVPFTRAQPIDAFSAEVAFSPGLAEQLTGHSRCYVGLTGATSECAVTQGERSVTIAPITLAPDEGVSVAVGLAPGAVVQPAERLPNFALDTLPLLLGGGAVAVGGAGAIAIAGLGRRRRGTRPVVAQYEVPHDLPPLLAGPLVSSAHPTPPAELVHLALLGATRVEEVPRPDGRPRKRPKLAFRLLDPMRAADPLDGEAVDALFPARTPNSVFELPKESSSFAAQMDALAARGPAEALARGYQEKVRSRLGRWLGWTSIALGLGVLGLAIAGIGTRLSATPFIGFLFAVLALVLGVIGIVKHRVLTPRGAEARNLLLGVKEFIRVAEADRIAMLQAASTAERRTIEGAEVIELYERLLPYAMLFGLEKEWGRALATRYEAEPGYLPLWYPGVLTTGLGGLDRAVSQLTSSLANATSTSSSSAGGSTGGGFAGGGGGGGFAGGR